MLSTGVSIGDDYGCFKLGECTFTSPLDLDSFTSPDQRILVPREYGELVKYLENGRSVPSYDPGGPRERIFFEPSMVRCGIVTCGGLCPGLNNIIHALVTTAGENYGLSEVLGFQGGFLGLTDKAHDSPRELTVENVGGITRHGGTILKTSRGPQNSSEMVDTLLGHQVNILFVIGGDGTLQGAHRIAEEIRRRDLKIAVVVVPKTIDNDIPVIDRTFGFETAVEAAAKELHVAYTEACSVVNGVTMVKFMGRDAGFIPAHATLAAGNVDFCLIPEQSFHLGQFLDALTKRLLMKGHAVIALGEGACQEIIPGDKKHKDVSGNDILKDVGPFLENEIRKYFTEHDIAHKLRYMDPGYSIRGLPANMNDASYCTLLAQSAVHAGMAGFIDLLVGTHGGRLVNIPTGLVYGQRKKVDLNGEIWKAVLNITRQ
jgi:6-phosphofructokinase 1